MTTPVLRTKLYMPLPRPNLVPRPRLVGQLEEGMRLGRTLTVISAPAGYGKTTLLSEWIAGWGQPPVRPAGVAWLSLDEGDNDPARFFASLVAACKTVDSRIGHVVDTLLQTPQMPPAEVLVAELINDIAAGLSGASPDERLLLVLDDYHVITELAIHEAVGFLAERQPPQMHLAITTRHDPLLPLSRLRGRGQVTEIRESDLRLTVEEATTFLNQTMGLDLTPADVAALEGRTEGWVAGLQMAALSLHNRDADDATRFIASFSGRHHFILDYLADEVLGSQPQSIQTFLIFTSVLERMTAPLCDAVLSQAERPMPLTTQKLLEHLDTANLFVVPLDDERQWYRYHRLFSDLLRSKLQELHPELMPELHRRAATWYDRHGLGADAVHHALAAGDDPLAADVIERVIQQVDTWTRVDGVTLLGWVQALPDELARSRPRLRLFTARALYATGQTNVGEQLMLELERSLQADPSVPGATGLLESVYTDLASFAAVRGDLDQAIDYAHQVLARLPTGDELARIRPTAVLGLAHFRAGDVSQAASAFLQVIATARAAGIEFAAVPFACNLAESRLVQGQLRQAFHILEQAEQTAYLEGRRSASTAFVDLGLGKILYEWNELERAEGHTRIGLDQLRQGGIPASFGTGHALLAQILQARGDPAGAQAAMGQAVQLAQSSNIPRLAIQAAAHQARLWLAQHQFERAIHWAQSYQQLPPAQYLREFEDMALARVLLALGDAAGAQALLDRLLSPALFAERMGSVVEVQVLRALAVAGTARMDQALQVLERALALAEPEGYVRVFVDEGQPMARLLVEARKRGISSAYVTQLLSALGIVGHEERPVAPAGRSSSITQRSPLVEPLTPREIQVLELLAEGLTNAEICQRLFISLPTVKSHTRNIYGKLGVHSRGQAVTQARTLGLLPPL